MKRLELIFAFLQLPLDYCMLVLGGLTAYSLRFAKFITTVRPVLFVQNLTFDKFWPTLLLVALGWIIIFAFSGLYHANPNRKLAKDIARIITACSTGFAAITIYVFFTLQKFDSRFLVLAGWMLATAYVIIGRIVLRNIKGLLYHYGIGLRKIIIIGKETVAETLRQTFRAERRFGYEVISTFEHFDQVVAEKIATIDPDEIIFADPKSHVDETLSAIDFANEHHITFKYSADLFDTISANMAISTVAGIPIIELGRTRLSGWGRIIKRIIDVFGSLFFLVLLSPVFLIVSIIVALETGFPILYRNERVGQYGKNFMTLKFRSMYQKDSTGPQFGGEIALKKEQELIVKQNTKPGPVYKIANDPRVTPFGHFIRRWSIDELPNFWNVLKGEMSLVGPRPHQPREVAGYQKQHRVLHSIKPGITGMAQISGRSSLTFEEEARLDTYYIENWSLFLDIVILVKTPFAVLKRKGAW